MVAVNDRMQQGYRSVLVAPIGRDFHPDFQPDLTPPEMLALGVFGGKYMTDCRDEFPNSWFAEVRLSSLRKDPSLNWFGVDASQPLSVWRRDGSIPTIRVAGSSGTAATTKVVACRVRTSDRSPVGKAIRRHIAQLRRACEPADCWCRPRQRQALLHWAYDSRSI